MEEKERFEIHIYDDVCVDLYNNGVLDKSINDIYKLEKLLNQQDREINRLTKMLYTTTKYADKLNEENNKLNKIIKANIISADKVVKENQQLKQQLAEKDRQLKLAEELLIKQEKEYDEQLEKQAKIHYRHLKEKDQDKISFAVKQILDIKEEVFGTREMGIIFDIPPVQDAFDVIENKIKQLKEGK